MDLRLSGRADAVTAESGHLTVTEVKTCSHPPGDPLGSRPDHVLQLVFYARALAESAEGPVSARLAYIPAAPDSDREPVIRSIDPFGEAAGRLWDMALDQVCTRIRDYLDHRRELLGRLEGEAFPYPSPRPGQKEMMRAVAREVGRGGRLMIQAPTGSGKTAAVLAGAIPAALRRGRRLFFLTSKNTQKRIVRETVAALHAGGADVRTLLLRSREAACPRRLPVCIPDRCPYAEDFGTRLLAGGLPERLLGQSLIDPEMVEELAGQSGVCPFELALAISRWCELVVCDCNYVYGPHVRLRRFLDEPAAASLCVALVDEAANLPDRARGYWSPEVRSGWIEEAGRRHRGLVGMGEVLRPWRKLMARLGSGSPLFGAGEGDVTGRVSLPGPSPAWAEVMAAVEEPSRALLNLYRSVRDIELLDPDNDPRYRLFLTRGDGEVSLQWFCADPSGMLATRQVRLDSVVAFSATLSPADHFRRELGLEDSSLLETAYPFPRGNLGLWIDPAVDTRYRARRDSLPLLAQHLEAVYLTAPGTYLVYFPSYAYARMAGRALEKTEIPLFRQERAMRQEERRELFERISRGPGLALLVSGGVFAEGVEFGGSGLRGAVIVGPSLPAVSPRRSFIRSWFDSQGIDGFEKAYLAPGMARAVQAAGRVVRSAGQKGTVILMGRRFAGRRMLRLMPSYWFRDGGIPGLSPGMAELREFWEG
jgi:DNA excision repair protein ERCC-2